uniref:Uncharacterized protein n=1 Tax=Panagrolaimus davidi TaxID=227884 RepID=A0A914R764_9BILA
MRISNSTPSYSIPKKPILNREILEDIFIEIMNRKISLSSELKSKEQNIERFMASGRQPFNIALNYFTRINRVDIWTNIILLWMNNEYICDFTFELFVFLKPVLYAIESIKKFVFCDAVGVDVDMIFDALIHEGIEYVRVEKKRPEKSLTKLCKINSIKDLSGFFTYSHLPLICSKSPAFGFYTDFKELIKQKPEKFSMPWVKDLLISSNYEIPGFTKNSTQLFSKRISQIFPNLETINIYFHCINPTWESVYEKMKIIKPNWFKNLSENVKGKIRIYERFDEVEREEWHRPIERFHKFDSYIAGRAFFIHQNLELDFSLQFIWKNKIM